MMDGEEGSSGGHEACGSVRSTKGTTLPLLSSSPFCCMISSDHRSPISDPPQHSAILIPSE